MTLSAQVHTPIGVPHLPGEPHLKLLRHRTLRPLLIIQSQLEGLLEDADGVLGSLDRVACDAGVVVDLVVVAALEGLVAEEMDGGVLDSAGLLCVVLEVLKAVGLVPASGEDIKRDLAANGVSDLSCMGQHFFQSIDRSSFQHSRQAKVGESLLELCNEGLTDLVLLVIGLVLASLAVGDVTADGADVDHAVTELNEGAALEGDVEVRNVVQDEVDELFVLLLANPLDEAVGG
jgi:hypothetical protein